MGRAHTCSRRIISLSSPRNTGGTGVEGGRDEGYWKTSGDVYEMDSGTSGTKTGLIYPFCRGLGWHMTFARIFDAWSGVMVSTGVFRDMAFLAMGGWMLGRQ